MPAIIAGMGVMTAAFFALHAVAAAWVAELRSGGAFASALYTIHYYVGAGVVSWGIGLLYDRGGWSGLIAGLAALGVAAVAVAAAVLPRSGPDAGPRSVG
jgi:YNFM family putative membrane transporter